MHTQTCSGMHTVQYSMYMIMYLVMSFILCLIFYYFFLLTLGEGVQLHACGCMRDNLPCTEMCKCKGCTNKQEESIADDELDGEDIDEEENYSEY